MSILSDTVDWKVEGSTLGNGLREEKYTEG